MSDIQEKSNSMQSLSQRMAKTTSSTMPPVEQMQKSIIDEWIYVDHVGEPWDGQPACYVTNYLLAIECYSFAAYVKWFAEPHRDGQDIWYIMYFLAVGTSGAFGGLLHHIACHAFLNEKMEDDTRMKVFGRSHKQKTIDQCIDFAWRIVLASSVLSNFALVSLSINRYVSENWVYTILATAATCYVALAFWASVNLQSICMTVGYIPAMIFGVVSSVMVLEWKWSHPSNEIVVYVLKLCCGIVQALALSPSNTKFNHNALAHVLLSLAATFVFVHYKQ